MTSQEELEKKRKELRAEYFRLDRHSEKLAWCTRESKKMGMSYGKFVAWLGIQEKRSW